jgi:hypothetical protein
MMEMTFVIELRAFEDAPEPASRGTVDVDPTNPKAALEVLFERYNHGAPGAVEFGHRSLSVGDVVHLGETSWTCASVGWVAER